MPNDPVFEPIILFDARHLNEQPSWDFRFLPTQFLAQFGMPTSREDRRVNASPEELNPGWVGKLLNPSRLRPNLAISASSCGALSGMFGSRDGRRNKKKAT
jgi:hypothetical protein